MPTSTMRYPFATSDYQRGAIEVAGNVYWLDNTQAQRGDSVSQGRVPGTPFSTLDYAVSRMRANKGDVLYVAPGHAETTTLIGIDVAGIKIVGLGYGRTRPTFTSTAVATDLLAVSAANVEIENIRLVGAASACTSLMALTGVDFVGRRMAFEQAATPLTGVLIGAAHRFRLKDCVWSGSANGPDRCISITTKCHDWSIIRPRAMFGQFGLDNEFIKSVAACLGYSIEDPLLIGLDTLVVNLASSSASPPDGLWVGGSGMYSAALTSIEDGVAAATSLGLAFARPFYVTDVTGKSGGKIPLATAQ